MRFEHNRYGYFEIDAPDGYKVKVYIDNRRDPFDLVGVYVDDVESAVAYYQNILGMKVRSLLSPSPPPLSLSLFGE